METLRSFGFGPLSVARLVSLPSAAPFIATGVRVAASFAFVVAVAVELIGTGMARHRRLRGPGGERSGRHDRHDRDRGLERG